MANRATSVIILTIYLTQKKEHRMTKEELIEKIREISEYDSMYDVLKMNGTLSISNLSETEKKPLYGALEIQAQHIQEHRPETAMVVQSELVAGEL